MAMQASASKRNHDARYSQATADQQGIENRACKNHLWLPQGFIREYWSYQAEKLAIIGRAFAQVVASDEPITQPRAIPSV